MTQLSISQGMILLTPLKGDVVGSLIVEAIFVVVAEVGHKFCAYHYLSVATSFQSLCCIKSCGPFLTGLYLT